MHDYLQGLNFFLSSDFSFSLEFVPFIFSLSLSLSPPSLCLSLSIHFNFKSKKSSLILSCLVHTYPLNNLFPVKSHSTSVKKSYIVFPLFYRNGSYFLRTIKSLTTNVKSCVGKGPERKSQPLILGNYKIFPEAGSLQSCRQAANSKGWPASWSLHKWGLYHKYPEGTCSRSCTQSPNSS